MAKKRRLIVHCTTVRLTQIELNHFNSIKPMLGCIIDAKAYIACIYEYLNLKRENEKLKKLIEKLNYDNNQINEIPML